MLTEGICKSYKAGSRIVEPMPASLCSRNPRNPTPTATSRRSLRVTAKDLLDEPISPLKSSAQHARVRYADKKELLALTRDLEASSRQLCTEPKPTSPTSLT